MLCAGVGITLVCHVHVFIHFIGACRIGGGGGGMGGINLHIKTESVRCLYKISHKIHLQIKEFFE